MRSFKCSRGVSRWLWLNVSRSRQTLPFIDDMQVFKLHSTAQIARRDMPLMGIGVGSCQVVGFHRSFQFFIQYASFTINVGVQFVVKLTAIQDRKYVNCIVGTVGWEKDESIFNRSKDNLSILSPLFNVRLSTGSTDFPMIFADSNPFGTQPGLPGVLD